MTLKNLDHKDVWVRAGKTALVTALGAIAVLPDPFSTDALLTVSVGVGSAVLNYLIQVYNGTNQAPTNG